MLSNLLRLEYLYNGYLQMSVKYAESETDAIRTTMDELVENLERIEMELQGVVKPLEKTLFNTRSFPWIYRQYGHLQVLS